MCCAHQQQNAAVLASLLGPGAKTIALHLKVDSGMTWDAAIQALEDAKALATQRGEDFSDAK